ncbi:LysR substrate binding domain-containing protein [Roseivivax halotolerans]|uniref:LysR substrate binding domain-containing protein n=1 Tax=Roseivivax halotolerans TaxID=93684 RepID=A0A1I6AEF3_9RHOB|nr:LysR substrate-binding domain-containing protein [Roseivivax halotolerans]SFQ67114.1 LysR substrate binding domain-containing protein [Roseivivax halotolerans]
MESTRLPFQPRFELDALDAIALMVNRGLGVAVVPDWPGPRPEGIRLRKVPLPAHAPERRIGLLFSRHGPQTRLVEVLDEATRRIGSGDTCVVP